jgi:hypothetical protein
VTTPAPLAAAADLRVHGASLVVYRLYSAA